MDAASAIEWSDGMRCGTTIHLVRHGEVHNPRQILYGRLPRFGLTSTGRQQARRCGRRLKAHGIDAVYTSPLLRARQTALEIIRQCGPLKMHVSTRLNEVHTVFEGQPGALIDERQGDIYTGAPTQFEQPGDIVRRVLAFIQRVHRKMAGGRIAAVTHGDVVTFMVLWAKGAALTPANKIRLLRLGYPEAYPAHASITTFSFASGSPDGKPAISYFNPTV